MSEKLKNTEKIDSTTETTINHWNLDKTKEQPEPYHYGGKQNNGKVLTVSADGFIRLAEGGGGGTPATYIKDITQASNTYTATKKDDTTITWTIPTATSYTGENGISVDNTTNKIGLDKTGSTTPELSNLKITGDLVFDTVAQTDFNDSDVDLGLNAICGIPTQTNSVVNKLYCDSNFLTASNIDGTTIKYNTSTNQLYAVIPASTRVKGVVADVSELPATANVGDIYFVKPSGSTTSTQYCWIDSTTQWAIVGSTEIDTSTFETKSNKKDSIDSSMTTEQLKQYYISGKCLKDNLDSIADALANKQNNLTSAQLNACNSGITSSKVSTYDGYASTIAGKSTVSVSDTGTSTNDLPKYMTIDGTEYKTSASSKLYIHKIEVTYSPQSAIACLTIISSDSTALTTSTMQTAIENYFGNYCSTFGFFGTGSSKTGIMGFNKIGRPIDYKGDAIMSLTWSSWTITDTVTQLL